MLAKILGVIIIIGLVLTFFKNFILWVVGIILLLILIRLLADLYWWYKDRGR